MCLAVVCVEDRLSQIQSHMYTMCVHTAYIYTILFLSCVLTNIQIITTHNNDNDDDDHVSDGNIVLTAFSADGNHLWYLSGAIYLAVISLPNIAHMHVYIMLYT